MKSIETNSAVADTTDLNTPQVAATWLGISVRTLLQNARAGRIPCVKINRRVLRFHRPTILAALQK